MLREAGLDDNPQISVEEKILILIQACCGQSNRRLGYLFQHSGDAISKIIRQALIVMRSMSHLFLVVPNENFKFVGYSYGCIGCLDGTIIPAVVFEVDATGGAYRDRKRNITQNVLGVCNFDMTFQYILAGWEGSAHDSRVLGDGKDQGLPFLVGKFYLMLSLDGVWCRIAVCVII